MHLTKESVVVESLVHSRPRPGLRNRLDIMATLTVFFSG